MDIVTASIGYCAPLETAKGDLSTGTVTDAPLRPVKTTSPSGFTSIALDEASMPAALSYSPAWTWEANSLTMRTAVRSTRAQRRRSQRRAREQASFFEAGAPVRSEKRSEGAAAEGPRAPRRRGAIAPHSRPDDRWPADLHGALKDAFTRLAVKSGSIESSEQGSMAIRTVR